MVEPQALESDSTLLLTEIENVFGEWLPCESQNHDESTSHGGPESGGEWYVTKRCPSCSHTLTVLICNEYADLVRSFMMENSYVGCMVCGYHGDINEFFSPPVSRKPLG